MPAASHMRTPGYAAPIGGRRRPDAAAALQPLPASPSHTPPLSALVGARQPAGSGGLGMGGFATGAFATGALGTGRLGTGALGTGGFSASRFARFGLGSATAPSSSTPAPLMRVAISSFSMSTLLPSSWKRTHTPVATRFSTVAVYHIPLYSASMGIVGSCCV